MPEFFDVYSIDRHFLNKTSERGTLLPPGEYHIVVLAVILNQNGELLITRRSVKKSVYTGKWECPAGSVIAGESSLAGMIREVKEEIGLDVVPVNKAPIAYFIEEDSIFDVWLIKTTYSVENLILNADESDLAQLVKKQELVKLIESGKTIPRMVEIIKLAENGIIGIAE